MKELYIEWEKIANPNLDKYGGLVNSYGRDTVLKALSIPVIYNESFWDRDGNYDNVKLVIIEHNPKLPDEEEVYDLLIQANCLKEAYHYWNEIFNGNYNFPKPTSCLKQLTKIFREHYFKDYIKIDNFTNNYSSDNSIFIFDISPWREVPCGKSDVISGFIYTRIHELAIIPDETWLIGGDVWDFFGFTGGKVYNGKKIAPDELRIKKELLTLFNRNNTFLFPFGGTKYGGIKTLIGYKATGLCELSSQGGKQ